MLEGAEENTTFSKLSPFAINRWIYGAAPFGVKSIKKLRSGQFLIECTSEIASEQILKLDGKTCLNETAKVSRHKALNSSKGVIRCKDLRGMTDLEIRNKLAEKGVLDVHRLTVTKADGKTPTDTFFLTFATPTPPSKIRIGYLEVPVSPYIPSPLRCFKCQRLGHTSKRCTNSDICAKCGHDIHENDCIHPEFCVNCKGNHPSSSKKCPKWIEESQIQRVKVEKKCSFTEAKQIIERQSGITGPTFAKVASSMPSVSQNNEYKKTSSVSQTEQRILNLLENFEKRVQKLESLIETLTEKFLSIQSATGGLVWTTNKTDNPQNQGYSALTQVVTPPGTSSESTGSAKEPMKPGSQSSGKTPSKPSERQDALPIPSQTTSKFEAKEKESVNPEAGKKKMEEKTPIEDTRHKANTPTACSSKENSRGRSLSREAEPNHSRNASQDSAKWTTKGGKKTKVFGSDFFKSPRKVGSRKMEDYLSKNSFQALPDDDEWNDMDYA